MTASDIESSEASANTIPAFHGGFPLLSEDKMRELLECVSFRIYKPIAQFEITAWRTPEPVGFEHRLSGEKLQLQCGDCWGDRLFDCAWFRFTSEISRERTEDLVARIDINGELYICDGEGMPLRGLTCKESVFDRKLGTPSKVIYFLPQESVREGRLELWADAAFNDLFGSLPGEGRIELAEVCECRRDIRALFYDLEVLIDLIAGLEIDDSFRMQVAEAISRVEMCLGEYSAKNVAEGRGILSPFLQNSPQESALRVSAIGHAHLDLAWLWPIRETIRKGARTFATALYNLERYPEYIFGCSQPQLFAWVKEFYPSLYQRVKEAVMGGRIELLGTFWVEPDCNIPCGESFVRQVLHGASFFRQEFGIVPQFCWQPDVFGYNGQLPQILKKSGHHYFMTQKLSWNVVNRFPHHSFQWKGIDGTGILTHMLPEETYNSPAGPHSLRKIGNEYAQQEVSDHALLVFGIGDGGGGPDAEHLERLRRSKSLPGIPSVEVRLTSEFFQDWAEGSDKFPCWNGELYLERHQGTLTTQALTKKNNRLCEIALRELEWAALLASHSAGLRYPVAELDRLWKEVLLYQFHDILPGSSIKRVYDEANTRYVLILEELDRLVEQRYQALGETVLSSSSHLAFNSLPWHRRQWLNLDGEWHSASVPGMGYAEPETPEAEVGIGVFASDNLIENERLRVRFADNGSVDSIFDKAHGKEVLAPGSQGNQFVIYADAGDAWDFETNLQEKDVWIYLRQEFQQPVLHSRSSYLDGPCAVIDQTFHHGASRIHQRCILRQGEENLEFETQVLWAEPRAMLRVRFPVAVSSPVAHYEIPFGSIARSTRENDLFQKAQIEVPSHQWVDISNKAYGVALLNDCKYGFRIKGHTLDMCLIRSVPHPGTALIGKEDRSSVEQAAEFTDLGEHHFRYALRPHIGAINEADLTKAAREFNTPLRVVAHKPNSSGLPKAGFSWLQLSNPAIEVPAVKLGEDGCSWIIRLINLSPITQTTQIALTIPFESILETNLLEELVCSQNSIPIHKGAISLIFAPFELKTLRCIKA
jgi:alpha-mannosidase